MAKKLKKWPVFICYRQSDGKDAASRVHDLLHGQQVTSTDAETGDEEAYVLDVYFDQTAPADKDWTAIHEPYLKRARAFIVICTPGAKLREDGDDWVHKELDWWLKNNEAAPILIDALGEEGRYVPEAIAARWPKAQRVRLVADEWEKLSPKELKQEQTRTRERLIGGITRSGEHYLRRELEQEKERAEQLQNAVRRTRTALLGAIALALVAGGAGWLAYQNQKEATANEQFARKAQADADQERERAEKTRNEALLSQSQFLTDFAQKEIEANKPVMGILLSLEALTDEKNSDQTQRQRPYWWKAQTVLDRAIRTNRERAVLNGHQDYVRSVTVSPDGTFIVTGSRDNTVRIWDVKTGTERAVLEGHRNYVNSVAVSPDSDFIVTGSWGNSPRIWDAKTGTERTALKGHENSVISVAVSPDSAFIVTGSVDSTARIWNSRTGIERAVLKGHCPPEMNIPYPCAVTSVAVSPDGAYIVTGSHDSTARIWDVKTGTERAVLTGHRGRVDSVAVSPDGTFIVTASFKDNLPRIWDAKTGTQRAVLKGHRGFVTSVAVSPDSSFIVTGSNDPTARIWDAKTGTQRAILKGHPYNVSSVAVSPDSTFVVTGSLDSTARIWDAWTGTQRAVLEGHHVEGSVYGVAVSPDGNFIVTGLGDNTAIIWDARTSTERVIVKGAVYSLAVSPDGTFIVTGSHDSTARIWDAKTGTRRVVLKGHQEYVGSVVVSPDGAFIVTGSADTTVRIWDTNTGIERAVLEGHESAVDIIAVSPNGDFIVTVGSREEVARIWDVKTGTERAVLEGHCPVGLDYPYRCTVTSVAVSPNGNFIVTGSEDNTARIWDAKTGTQRAVLKGHESTINSVAVSPDGTFIVTGSKDDTARIWDAKTGTQRAVLDNDPFDVTAVAVSPDSTFIVTGSDDHIARIWDTKTGSKRAALMGHESPINSVAVSPDGSFIVTGSGNIDYRDDTVRIWDVKTGTERAVLKGHQDYVSTVAVSPDSMFIVTSSWDKTARIWEAFMDTQILVDHAKSSVARCLTITQRSRFFLTPVPPRWCITGPAHVNEQDPAKWQPKWPYHSAAWREWLVAKNRGENLLMPKE